MRLNKKNIDTSKWQTFYYHEVFTIKKGKRLIKDDFVKGTTPFIGAIDSNNGYRDFIRQEPIHEGNTITVNYNGSVGEAFYQPNPFWASDDVNVLYPKFSLNKYIALFLIPLIRKEIYRFNYGRKWESTRMRESTIKLPVIKKDILDLEFMESYVRNLECSKIIEDKFSNETAKSFSNSKINLSLESWKYFEMPLLFKLTGTKTTSVLELEEYGEGAFPYVTTQATNNGIGGFFDYYTEEGNVLTVDSAVIGYCSYQPFNFSASDHVEKLTPRFEMNKYVAEFLVTIINKEQYRFNYGRKASQKRLKEVRIYLPAKKGQPDFEFMEEYIKSLPFSLSL